MREFFKGWKRKAGVVTLALACVFLVIWGWCQNNSMSVTVWQTATTECNLSLGTEVWELSNGEIGFNGAFWQLNGIWAINVSHWSIVIPLTLLSAYLLLGKPRPTAPKQSTEPPPTAGA